MSKGIIYIMTSVLPGLIKIGKTGSDSFETRIKLYPGKWTRVLVRSGTRPQILDSPF